VGITFLWGNHFFLWEKSISAKGGGMKKVGIFVGILVAALLIVPSFAFSWGSLVHAYIAWELAPGNFDVIYGTVAPDIPNYAFWSTVKDDMYEQFHTYPELMWNGSGTLEVRSLGYGFMNHKQDDQTAHFGAVRFGKTEGYVIAKAKVLDSILADKFPEYAYIKSLAPDLSLSIAHNIVENSIDILLYRVDPSIGGKLYMAAAGRNQDLFVGMLTAAYPAFAADIPRAEAEFNALMTVYGGLFTLPDEQMIIHLLSQQMAAYASVYLPEGFPPLDPDLAYEIVRTGTVKGMNICRGTFLKEIKLTIEQARQNLSGYSIQ